MIYLVIAYFGIGLLSVIGSRRSLSYERGFSAFFSVLALLALWPALFGLRFVACVIDGDLW